MDSSCHVIFSYRTLAIFFSGCLIVFLSSGSFKANGVLFDDAVVLFNTSSLFGGWAFSFQLSVAFIIAGVGGVIFEGASYRAMGVTGGILFGTGFTCIGIFGHQLWQLFLFNGITACGSGLLYFANFMTFLDHFQEEFATFYSVRELFNFIGVTTVPVLVDALRSNYGFYGSYFILGSISFNTVVSGILMAPVQSNSPLKPAKAPATINLTDKERKYKKVITSQLFGVIEVLKKVKNLLDFSPVLKHPVYAIFVLIYSLFSYNFVAWAIFLVPFGKSIGLSPEAAVILSTAGGLGGLVGKLAVFFLFYFRKMNSMTSSLVPALMAFVGLTGYLFSINYAVLLLSSGAFGFSCAYSDTALCGLIPRYVCKTHLKQGTVLSYLFSGIFAQLGGIMSGAILDFTSSFYVIFGTMICLDICVCILAIIMFILETPVPECSS